MILSTPSCENATKQAAVIADSAAELRLDHAEIASKHGQVKSPEKREALLQSAVREIAESGLGVSTAKIAKGAGLAEGTMFRYFPSKNDLLNALYLELKIEVLRAIGG